MDMEPFFEKNLAIQPWLQPAGPAPERERLVDLVQWAMERDSMGEIEIPDDALWGAPTQRAVENFAVSGLRFGRRFIQALGWVKRACAQANMDLGLL